MLIFLLHSHCSSSIIVNTKLHDVARCHTVFASHRSNKYTVKVDGATSSAGFIVITIRKFINAGSLLWTTALRHYVGPMH